MRTHLHGRGDELTALSAAVQQAARGRSTVVTLTGAPGHGKTAVVEALVESVPADVVVLRAAGHPAEAEIAYGGLHQLLEPVRALLPAAGAARLAAVLGFVPDVLPDPGVSRDVVSTVLAQEFLTALGVLAGSRTLLLVVDDAHLLDPSSTALLTFVARRLEADPVCLVFAVDAVAASDWLSVGSALPLAPLPTTAARRLARDGWPDLSPAVADWVVEQSGGVPLLVVEVAGALSAGQRTGVTELPRRLAVPGRVDTLYSARLAGLGQRCRRALLIAAVDDPAPSGTAQRLAAAGLTPDDLDEAERLGLVRVDGGSVTFASATARFCVRNSATDSESRDAHRVVAESLDDDPVRHAVHLHLAGAPDASSATVAMALARAAALCSSRGAAAEAGRLWQWCADHEPDPTTRRQALGAAAEAYVAAGLGVAAEAVLDELIASAVGVAERVRWQTVRIAATMWGSLVYPEDAEALVAEASALQTGADQDAAAAGHELLVTLAYFAIAHGDNRAARDVASTLVPVAGGPAPNEEAVRVLLDAVGHDDDWASVRERAQALLPGLGADEPLDPAAISVAAFSTLLGWVDPGTCQGVLDRFDERTGAGRVPVGAMLARGFLAAFIAEKRGNWALAAAELDQAMRTASDSEFTGPFAYYALMHAYLLARQGRDEESRAIRESLHPRVNASPGVAFLAACVTGMEHLSAGRFDQAVTALREADDIGRRSGGVVPGLGTRSADEFEALWRAGRLDEAAAVAAAYSSEAAVTGHPTDLALAARCRAALSAPLDLDDAFAAALSSMDPVSMPFETARTRLIHGQRLRRERRKADAVRELAAALDLFGRLGAETWSETTRRELAACGRRRTSARPGSPLGELTPREHAVAQEAARGRTNAEAAARLFISPRTVEYHLANSYRKLGVRDRQALAQFFGE